MKKNLQKQIYKKKNWRREEQANCAPLPLDKEKYLKLISAIGRVIKAKVTSASQIATYVVIQTLKVYQKANNAIN